MWTIIKDNNIMEKALSLCKGIYQRNLIYGIENLSGSTLAGKAKYWSSKYRVSRENLLHRLKENDIPVKEIRGDHNKRILVLG